MGLTTQDPYTQKEHTKLYKILKFRVNCANIEQDTAIQKRKNLVTNVWIAGRFQSLPCCRAKMHSHCLQDWIWEGCSIECPCCKQTLPQGLVPANVG